MRQRTALLALAMLLAILLAYSVEVDAKLGRGSSRKSSGSSGGGFFSNWGSKKKSSSTSSSSGGSGSSSSSGGFFSNWGKNKGSSTKNEKSKITHSTNPHKPIKPVSVTSTHTSYPKQPSYPRQPSYPVQQPVMMTSHVPGVPPPPPPPSGGYYAPSALPVGAVLYPHPPPKSSSGNFETGLLAGYFGSRLLDRHNHQTVVHHHHHDGGNNNPSNGGSEKVIIINNQAEQPKSVNPLEQGPPQMPPMAPLDPNQPMQPMQPMQPWDPNQPMPPMPPMYPWDPNQPMPMMPMMPNDTMNPNDPAAFSAMMASLMALGMAGNGTGVPGMNGSSSFPPGLFGPGMQPADPNHPMPPWDPNQPMPWPMILNETGSTNGSANFVNPNDPAAMAEMMNGLMSSLATLNALGMAVNGTGMNGMNGTSSFPPGLFGPGMQPSDPNQPMPPWMMGNATGNMNGTFPGGNGTINLINPNDSAAISEMMNSILGSLGALGALSNATGMNGSGLLTPDMFGPGMMGPGMMGPGMMGPGMMGPGGMMGGPGGVMDTNGTISLDPGALPPPPPGGVMCFPSMVNETDPMDANRVVEVERILCFPGEQPTTDQLKAQAELEQQQLLEQQNNTTTENPHKRKFRKKISVPKGNGAYNNKANYQFAGIAVLFLLSFY